MPSTVLVAENTLENTVDHIPWNIHSHAEDVINTERNKGISLIMN